ncbi:MAG: D-glycero-beta-D-manno-heptose 1-phosphate adenylyltransferase [Desulfamplus sp.]|nr:D-glycero-beta-D-manno-heptose 1-phosphate adenylyltransferase [Desulfamplus sp.]
MKKLRKLSDKKLIDELEIATIINLHKLENHKIVFTNGCFDILHAGHVAYLDAASNQGDILVVGLNSDNSVKKIKGERRPIVSQTQRAKVLAALECVDYVVIFDEPDPENLIKKIAPDVLVKGADWSEEKIIGSDFVKKLGGKVERIELVPEISTTTIIERIVMRYGS